jgi:protein SCO1/2
VVRDSVVTETLEPTGGAGVYGEGAEEGHPPPTDGERPPPRRSLLVQALSLSLLIVLLAVVIVLGFMQVAPPVIGEVPEFRFTDQSGAAFGSRELAGRVWVGDFIFTQCRAACPGMTARFVGLQRAIESRPELADSVRLVSFSVDPERDSPERLREFAKRHGAKAEFWSFLTAPSGAVAELSLEAFALTADPPSTGGPTHSDRFVLVDRQGRLRGNYRPTVNERDLTRLLADIEAVVKESPVER